jgi:hypothetical protein
VGVRLTYQCIAFVFLFTFSIYARNSDFDEIKNYFFSPDITSLPISDWHNPSNDDLRIIQEFTNNKVARLSQVPISKRPFSKENTNKEFYEWCIYRLKSRGLLSIDKQDTTVSSCKFIYFNNNPNDKEKCIIIYITHPSPNSDRDYTQGLEYIIKALEKTNYDGHLIYYIGSWPGLKKGRLKYADVPYSFKPFFFEEVRDLGYENILWLDACVVPIKNLKPLFDFLEEKGCCFHAGRTLKKNELNLNYKQIYPNLNTLIDQKEVISQIVGINTKNPHANELLDRWIQNAEQKVPFLMGDQVPLGFLIHDLGLQSCKIPSDWYYVGSYSNKFSLNKSFRKNVLLYHNYKFLNPLNQEICDQFISEIGH